MKRQPAVLTQNDFRIIAEECRDNGIYTTAFEVESIAMTSPEVVAAHWGKHGSAIASRIEQYAS